jgi:hypothetical protein
MVSGKILRLVGQAEEKGQVDQIKAQQTTSYLPYTGVTTRSPRQENGS